MSTPVSRLLDSPFLMMFKSSAYFINSVSSEEMSFYPFITGTQVSISVEKISSLVPPVEILISVVWSSREGNGTPLQYSYLENPMDGGAWWATVHGVTKSRTQLSNFTSLHGKEMRKSKCLSEE